MELENIIYIVAVIVIFIVSLLGQNKNKKVKPQTTEPEDDTIYSLNDFEKILERKQEFKQKEQPIEQVETVEEEKPVVVKEKKKKVEKIKTEETETDDGFDVKSAIIYSSILERKKFRR